MQEIIDRAFEEAGGAAVIARELGMSIQRVWNWRTREQIPAEFAIAVEKLTHGSVTRYEIAPNVFGPAPRKAKA